MTATRQSSRRASFFAVDPPVHEVHWSSAGSLSAVADTKLVREGIQDRIPCDSQMEEAP
jgi:hypothetical protein